MIQTKTRGVKNITRDNVLLFCLSNILLKACKSQHWKILCCATASYIFKEGKAQSFLKAPQCPAWAQYLRKNEGTVFDHAWRKIKMLFLFFPTRYLCSLKKHTQQQYEIQQHLTVSHPGLCFEYHSKNFVIPYNTTHDRKKINLFHWIVGTTLIISDLNRIGTKTYTVKISLFPKIYWSKIS